MKIDLTKQKVNLNQYMVFFAFVLLCIVLSIASPAFLTGSNIMNVLLQASTNAIIAVGMTMVVITSGIDLSVGSMVAFCSMTLALLYKSMQARGPVSIGMELVCIAVCIAAGAVLGFLNGFIITKGKLAPFIATLGMMSIVRGVSLTMCRGRPISEFGPIVRGLGSGRVGFIYTPVIIMIIVYLIAFYILKYTRTGRNIYAIGGNAEATRLSGINTTRVLVFVYTISGICAALVGIVLMGRMNSAQPTSGEGYEMDAIASTVIGGASLSGGQGGIFGTFLGALIISVLRNGLNLLSVTAYVQQIVIGAVIIGAVLFDNLRKKN